MSQRRYTWRTSESDAAFSFTDTIIPCEGLDYHLLRPVEGDQPDLDYLEYPCTCGATITVEAGTPGPGFGWRITHGGGEAVKFIGGLNDEHLLWIVGLGDPIGDWVRSIHRYEGARP